MTIIADENIPVGIIESLREAQFFTHAVLDLRLQIFDWSGQWA